MEKQFVDYLTEYAENELKIINFNKTNLGPTMIQFLRESAELASNDRDVMKMMAQMLERLIDMEPISMITENDFVEEERPDGKIMARCTRYPHLYRSPDGKYYNDRAIVFKRKGEPNNNKQYIYQGQLSSKQEISLPYYPAEQIIYLDDVE